jgi:RHS repeat-associated protein
MPYYYTRDQVGSVREMCNSSGTIVSRMAYDPYGRTTTVSGTILPTKQYDGDYQHQASGLALTQYRAYDANTGRWLSRDPLGETDDFNTYGFVIRNPLVYRDYDGLRTSFWDTNDSAFDDNDAACTAWFPILTPNMTPFSQDLTYTKVAETAWWRVTLILFPRLPPTGYWIWEKKIKYHVVGTATYFVTYMRWCTIKCSDTQRSFSQGGDYTEDVDYLEDDWASPDLADRGSKMFIC